MLEQALAREPGLEQALVLGLEKEMTQAMELVRVPGLVLVLESWCQP